jgi:hypothetical protein
MRKVLILAALLCAGASPEPPPDVACRLQGAGKVLLAGGPRGLVANLTGVGNQGGATLAFGGARPGRVTFRFANLRGMQSFTLTDGKQAYQVSLGWDGGKTTAYFDGAGRRVGSAALAAVTIDMQASPAGGVDVVVATRAAGRGKGVRVDWVTYPVVRLGFTDS